MIAHAGKLAMMRIEAKFHAIENMGGLATPEPLPYTSVDKLPPLTPEAFDAMFPGKSKNGVSAPRRK